MTDIYDIAIIGAGFSGLMVAAHYALMPVRDYGNKRPRIYMADRDGHQLGTAYATHEACHLLNVRAANMSAWPSMPDDFVEFLAAEFGGHWGASDFVPRRVYAQYLSDIRTRLGQRLKDHLTFDHNEIVNIQKRGEVWVLTGADGISVTARAVVMATGNPPPMVINHDGLPHIINNPWPWRKSSRPFMGAGPVVLRGAGLTAVDMVLSLRADGYEGDIFVVSPSGVWPAAHKDYQKKFDRATALVEGLMAKPTALHYLKTFKHFLREHCGDAGNDVGVDGWFDVIDSLRPYTISLWALLPDNEKAKARRHYGSLWNHHRHRMAPESAKILHDDMRLKNIAGRVDVTGGVIKITPKDAAAFTLGDGAIVVQCAGPNYGAMVDDALLLSRLVAQNFAQIGPMGWGIKAAHLPALDGEGLFALGTPLIGAWWETTAVPDLRGQAAAVSVALDEYLRK
jgi:uncharacterized NAD(P)/FAD-binding protein YdhS